MFVVYRFFIDGFDFENGFDVYVSRLMLVYVYGF